MIYLFIWPALCKSKLKNSYSVIENSDSDSWTHTDSVDITVWRTGDNVERKDRLITGHVALNKSNPGGVISKVKNQNITFVSLSAEFRG